MVTGISSWSYIVAPGADIAAEAKIANQKSAEMI